MKLEVDKKKKQASIIFNDGDRIDLTLNSKYSMSVLNKIHILQRDYEEVSSLIPEFEKDYKDIVTNINVYPVSKIYEILYKYAKIYIDDILKIDTEKYCDYNKKTSEAIFVYPEEIRELLYFFFIVKFIILFYMSSDYYIFGKAILRHALDKIRAINKKLLKLIKNRIRISILNYHTIELMKYIISEDYIALYNYNFTIVVMLSFFDFHIDMNPVSYIVTMTEENLNYSLLSLAPNKTNVINYTDNLEFLQSIDIDVQHGHFLYNISDLFIQNRLEDVINIILKDKSLLQLGEYHVTPLYEILLKMYNKILGLEIHHLRTIEPAKLQYLFYYIAKNRLQKHYQNSYELFLTAFRSKVSYRTTSVAPIASILAKDINLHGLKSKSILIDLIKKLSVIQSKKENLIFINTGERYRRTDAELSSMLEKILSIFLDLISEKQILDIHRKEFNRIIKFHKIFDHDKKKVISKMHF